MTSWGSRVATGKKVAEDKAWGRTTARVIGRQRERPGPSPGSPGKGTQPE